jgi:hypothetical protein
LSVRCKHPYIYLVINKQNSALRFSTVTIAI